MADILIITLYKLPWFIGFSYLLTFVVLCLLISEYIALFIIWYKGPDYLLRFTLVNKLLNFETKRSMIKRKRSTKSVVKPLRRATTLHNYIVVKPINYIVVKPINFIRTQLLKAYRKLVNHLTEVYELIAPSIKEIKHVAAALFGILQILKFYLKKRFWRWRIVRVKKAIIREDRKLKRIVKALKKEYQVKPNLPPGDPALRFVDIILDKGRLHRLGRRVLELHERVKIYEEIGDFEIKRPKVFTPFIKNIIKSFFSWSFKQFTRPRIRHYHHLRAREFNIIDWFKYLFHALIINQIKLIYTFVIFAMGFIGWAITWLVHTGYILELREYFYELQININSEDFFCPSKDQRSIYKFILQHPKVIEVVNDLLSNPQYIPKNSLEIVILVGSIIIIIFSLHLKLIWNIRFITSFFTSISSFVLAHLAFEAFLYRYFGISLFIDTSIYNIVYADFYIFKDRIKIILPKLLNHIKVNIHKLYRSLKDSIENYLKKSRNKIDEQIKVIKEKVKAKVRRIDMPPPGFRPEYNELWRLWLQRRLLAIGRVVWRIWNWDYKPPVIPPTEYELLQERLKQRRKEWIDKLIHDRDARDAWRKGAKKRYEAYQRGEWHQEFHAKLRKDVKEKLDKIGGAFKPRKHNPEINLKDSQFTKKK
jgi:hypothetical protein